jgi:hypothetical protein
LNTNNLRSIVYKAIDEINDGLDEDAKLPKVPNLVLTGDSGLLTSLQLVTLIAAIEDIIEDRFGERLSLFENLEDAFKQDSTLTISSLIKHIGENL